MPKRPLVATLLTTAALALLLSFKTPQVFSLATTPGRANNQNVAGSSPGVKSSYTGQVAGSAIQIPYGTVQVQVTFQNGQITDVQPLQMPNDRSLSQQIAQYAAPQLRSEVLAAQSAQVNTISGATYTSLGYLQSVQSALDQAGV
ncbi:MAG: FMN-binding protein [Candidatus Limnocylindrales bacterium]|jgi:uncharacterized protein with FMN-binding domain